MEIGDARVRESVEVKGDFGFSFVLLLTVLEVYSDAPGLGVV